jgi:hypothetical protein
LLECSLIVKSAKGAVLVARDESSCHFVMLPLRLVLALRFFPSKNRHHVAIAAKKRSIERPLVELSRKRTPSRLAKLLPWSW